MATFIQVSSAPVGHSDQYWQVSPVCLNANTELTLHLYPGALEQCFGITLIGFVCCPCATGACESSHPLQKDKSVLVQAQKPEFLCLVPGEGFDIAASK